MKKIILLLIFFCFAMPIAAASEVEEYVSVLQWKNKWGKITTRAIEGYIKRGVNDYPESFTEQQSFKASERIRDALSKRIGWDAMGGNIISSFRKECGDDLLDVLVEFYSGIEFTQEDRNFVADTYGSCAPKSMQGAMNSLVEEIESFVGEKDKILSSIGEK